MAPTRDTSLQAVLSYRSVDREVADVVFEKFKNHHWYLTEEVVPFVLFSTNPLVSDQTNEDIARKIDYMPIPDQFRLEKPVYREITVDTSLVDLVGPESTQCFVLRA